MKLLIAVTLLCLYFKPAVLEDEEIPTDNRIVGGQNAKIGDFPYIVSIRIQNRHVCGGSIITEKYILTAAHCVYNFENKSDLFSIQYGVLEITDDNPNVIRVKKIIRHDGYVNKDDYRNDIAILELMKKIRFVNNVDKVGLPTKFNMVPFDSDAEVAGWGLNGTRGHLHKNLQKVTIKIFTENVCGMSDASYNVEVHICAGIPGGGRGQCTGDSGGPLTIENVQYGIVSWSRKPCASPGHPGYFTEVANYRDWIYQHAQI